MTTLIRKPANPAQADVLRGERSPFDGDVTENGSERQCSFCGGRGTWIGGDEEHLCWCVRPDGDPLD
jgi:hypothetical protein